MVYHRILNMVPCAIQLDLIDKLFFHSVYNSLHLVTPNPHFSPPPPLWQPQVCFLHGSEIFNLFCILVLFGRQVRPKAAFPECVYIHKKIKKYDYKRHK